MALIEVSEKEMTEIVERSKEESFSFFMPMEKSVLAKSLESNTPDNTDPRSWVVAGHASTDSKDLDGEVVVPLGIQTDYFLREGLLTWDHKPGPENKVGTPTDAYVDNKGFYVKGFLWKPVPAAQHIRLLMKTFAEHPEYNRHVGWSIEGKTLKMEGNRIVSCWLKDATLTCNPINNSTYASLAKSLAGCDYYTIGGKTACSCKKPEDTKKALEAGYAVTDQTGGDALRTQDLERKLKILTNREGLSHDDLKEYAMMKSGFSAETADKIVNYARILKKTFYPEA
jgi:hypothetical protein